MTTVRKTWWMSLAVLGLAACSSTESRVPTTVAVRPSSSFAFSTSGRRQTLHAAVLDQHGDTLTGRTFTWASDNSGVVAVGSMAGDSAVIMSVASGTANVTITSGSLTGKVTVTVTLIAASDSLVGDRQLAMASATLASPIAVVLKDSSGHVARGDTVHFAVASGGGSVGASTGVTDANGMASTSWTLGASGAQAVAVSGPGFADTIRAEIVSGVSQAGFQVTVVNVASPFIPAVQAAFDSAAAFWGRVITTDVPDDPGFTSAQGACGPGTPAVGPINIDDVVILAAVKPIDGPGGILGEAGPCYTRTTNTNPDTLAATLTGVMEFDSADIQTLITSGQLSLVIKHEMAHVLGFGTFWGGLLGTEPGTSIQLYGKVCGVNLPASAGVNPDTYYACPIGRAYFDSIGGTNYTAGNKVPVENCLSRSNCGGGTYNSHWREGCVSGTNGCTATYQGLDNELMTGYLNPGVSNPVSKLTIAQFADLGYVVDYTQAETYTHTFTAPSAFQLITASMNLGNDARRPVFAKRPDGRITRIGPTPRY